MNYTVWLEVDDSIEECGPAEVASWASGAIQDLAVADEFNPPWPGFEFVDGESPEARIERLNRVRVERAEACAVKVAWMQHFHAEDIDGGEYPNETMTYLVTNLATGDRFYLKRTSEWQA